MPHALIVRTTDAATEHQPLEDVIEGDTFRLGKKIEQKWSRGRARKRQKNGSKNRRGNAPGRHSNVNAHQRARQTEGASQPPTEQDEGTTQSPTCTRIMTGGGHATDTHLGSDTQGDSKRATTKPNEPGNQEADGERNVAYPGMTNQDDPSGTHMRPVQKVAGGRQTGDVAAPDD